MLTFYKPIRNYIETHVPIISKIEPKSPNVIKQIIQILSTKHPKVSYSQLSIKTPNTNFLAFLASLFNAWQSMAYFPKE